MSTNQEQDLVIFKDNSIISDRLLSDSQSYSAVIGYVDGTHATWLVNSLIENSLVGTGCLVNKDLTKKVPNRAQTYFISFNNPAEFYFKSCKKNGLDLSRDTNFQYIDCFTDLFTKHITSPDDSKTQVKKLFESITSKISRSANTKKVIFIENPELLLSATNISSIELSNFILKLNRLCKVLFTISSHTLADLSITDSFDPAYKITDFLAKSHQKASLNIHLEPLTTGRAKDITGILNISTGSIPFEGVVVDQKSYAFNVSKESNIKLYFR